MYNPQPIQEKDKIQAWAWCQEHRDHVLGLMTESELGYAPSGSDCIRPELWKGAHWKWLMAVCPGGPLARTLVRIVEVSTNRCYAKVVLPGRDGAREHILLYRDQVPEEIWSLFEVDKRLHVKVNASPDIAVEELIFTDWERE